MQTPQKFRSDFMDLPPKMQGKVLEILKRNGGDNFNADALLQAPAGPGGPSDFAKTEFIVENFEGEREFETTSRRVPEFAPLFRSSPKDVEQQQQQPPPQQQQQQQPSNRFRPMMPKNKFEILQSPNKPVEEVTLQRVNAPLIRQREPTSTTSITTTSSGSDLDAETEGKRDAVLLHRGPFHQHFVSSSILTYCAVVL